MNPYLATGGCAALAVLLLAATFYLGRIWERDSGPRADPYGSVPFSPRSRSLAEQARSAGVQARYDRLLVVPPRGGLGLNQWADLVMEQAAKPPGTPSETLADTGRSPNWKPDYSSTSKGFPAPETEVESE